MTAAVDNTPARRPPWQATVLTLFPEMFPGPLGLSLAGKALAAARWRLDTVNIRDHALNRHRSVDDTAFGGGSGMVMRPDVVAGAIDAVADHPGPRIYLSPRGRRVEQSMVRDWAAGPGVVLLCGRYEGLDERCIEGRDLLEVSLGDFVLSGGEPAALALLDACIRLLPGVMGAAEGAAEDSFENGLLEYPLYTQPRLWEARAVPEILLSGHHAKIEAWRNSQSAAITQARRPDLWQRYLREHGDDQKS
jgi:tRNA (guanine37-N1)-methyltransferase